MSKGMKKREGEGAKDKNRSEHEGGEEEKTETRGHENEKGRTELNDMFDLPIRRSSPHPGPRRLIIDPGQLNLIMVTTLSSKVLSKSTIENPLSLTLLGGIR